MSLVDLRYAQEVIRIEAAAVAAMEHCLGDSFKEAAELLFGCSGSVILTGIGKAGLIAGKVSATLSSTGTPSHFLHPTEAVHGDLGALHKEDIVWALSYGGETEEILRLLNHVNKLGIKMIALTGNGESTLAKRALLTLDMGKIEEACPLRLAPSASTTAMLALGDALALTVMKMRDFNSEQFARFHPGGSIGRNLVTVEQSMMFRPGEPLPCVTDEVILSTALESAEKKTSKRRGCILIVDALQRLVGIITDGDLRRGIAADGQSYLASPIKEIMVKNPKRIHSSELASKAVSMMHEHRIDELPVVDDQERLIGLIDVQDVLVLQMLK